MSVMETIRGIQGHNIIMLTYVTLCFEVQTSVENKFLKNTPSIGHKLLMQHPARTPFGDSTKSRRIT